MPFDEGLTDAEVLRAETKYDIHFPDDLREFLQTVLPRGYPIYPDWRSGEEEWIRGKLRYSLDGILFDVEHNDFWRATGALSDSSTTISPVNQLMLFNL
jgi:hypothetical protein